MKTLLRFVFALCVGSLAFGQPASSSSETALRRSPDELQKLLSPIAIYPDALMALILPASTASSDVVLAARYLSAGGDPAKLDAQPWEPSVISLSRYPEIVKWMDQNLEWTRELGEAFATQPDDVMNAVQALRKKANQAGLLTDTPQQNVVVRDDQVYIEPTEPDVIYVPSYDPEVIYEGRPTDTAWLDFSVGFATGSWLFYDCDWRHHSILVYHHPAGWRYHPDWRWRDRDRISQNIRPWHEMPGHGRVQRVHNEDRFHRPVPHVEGPRFAGKGGESHNRENWTNHHQEHGVAPNSNHQAPAIPAHQRGEERNGRDNSNRSAAPAGPVRGPANGERGAPTGTQPQAAPSALNEHRWDNHLTRVGPEQPHRFVHESRGPVAPAATVPRAVESPAFHRERVGGLSPREGGRSIQRAPDAVPVYRSRQVNTGPAPAPAPANGGNSGDQRDGKNRR